MNTVNIKTFLVFIIMALAHAVNKKYKGIPCLQLLGCIHTKRRECGIDRETMEVRWFLDKCDVLEFNCEYETSSFVYRLDNGKICQRLCKQFRMKPFHYYPSIEQVYSILAMMSFKNQVIVCLFSSMIILCSTHGPPKERDNEDVAMGRKMGAKWCSMAKVCNHDRVPICGLSHAGDIMGFRDLCDMFDYNCIRRRNYKQTSCPEDKSLLTVSRRPTNSYFDD